MDRVEEEKQIGGEGRTSINQSTTNKLNETEDLLLLLGELGEVCYSKE